MSCTCTKAQLPESVRRLVEAVEASQDLTPTTAKRLLEESSVSPEDLAAWADFDHPAADSYGRTLIWDGGCFELMAMSWVDGDMAALHDHGYTQWGAVKLFGAAEHAVFKNEDGVLTTTDRREFTTGTVLAVSHDMIHQMGNVGKRPYLTLHLYGCYERDGNVTGDARLYELDEGKIQRTSGGVFFALPEEAVDRREAAPRADFPTYLRHQVELLRRLMRKNSSREHGELRSTREKRLAAELFSEELWQRAPEFFTRTQSRDPRSQERCLGIAFRELWALARLQLELIEHGLVDTELNAHRQQLQSMLDQEPQQHLAEAYLDLVARACDVQVPELLAA